MPQQERCLEQRVSAHRVVPLPYPVIGTMQQLTLAETFGRSPILTTRSQNGSISKSIPAILLMG